MNLFRPPVAEISKEVNSTAFSRPLPVADEGRGNINKASSAVRSRVSYAVKGGLTPPIQHSCRLICGKMDSQLCEPMTKP